jgi:transposase-like protein
MGRKRSTHSASFKAKVALEAMREQSTLAELSTRHGIHSTQISQWKSTATERLVEIFDTKRGPQPEADMDVVNELYREIGRQKMEIEFLKKRLGK